MAHSQILIQFCVRQDRLSAALEQFHQSMERVYEQVKGLPASHWDQVVPHLESLQKRLAKEVARFQNFLQHTSLGQLSVKDSLDRMMAQAHQLTHELRQRYRQSSGEEWKESLRHFSQKALQLKTELSSIDFKEALDHVAEAVLVDHFDDLGQRRRIQWQRKLFHVFGALLLVSVYLWGPGSYKAKVVTLGCVVAYALICDIIRLLWPRFNAAVIRDMKKYMRKREVSTLNSMTFYLMSSFLVIWLFPKPIAVLSILFLGFGDPLASWVGVRWGKHKITRRFSVEGSLTFFGVCFLISLLYPLLNPAFSGPLWLFAVLGGLSGMLSEWCSYRLDDNLTIPIVSALLLQGTAMVLGS